MKKYCSGCDQSLDIDQFNWKSIAKNVRYHQCKTCWNAVNRERYAKNKQYYIEKANVRGQENRKQNRKKVVEYLESHPCVDCPESDIVILTFDHVRGKKIGNISDMLRDYSWSSIQKEIDKCEVRCWNCHMRRTAKTRNVKLSIGCAG
jgi:hypothetical protein